jgi:nucleoside-diphosphate-sugar epimerase
MKVLVTGATGFLGRRLVRYLLGCGMNVRCLVRPASDVGALRLLAADEEQDRLELFTGTLERIESASRAVEGCSVVFHLASSAAGAPAVLFMDNVVGTRRLIELVHRSPASRFVLVSSLAVHGTAPVAAGSVLDEEYDLDPEPHRRDPYTYSKIVQEQVAWDAYREGRLPLVIVRPGVIYGPGRDPLTNRVGLRLGNVLLRMGGRQLLPYTFVDNCAEAVALAGTVPGIEGQAFNVVDDDPPTGRELLRRYRTEVKRLRVVPVTRMAIGPLSGLCEWYYRKSGGQLPDVLTRYKSQAQWKPLRYSNARAKTMLGWAPRVGFVEGLNQTFAWLRQQAGASQAAATSVVKRTSSYGGPP